MVTLGHIMVLASLGLLFVEGRRLLQGKRHEFGYPLLALGLSIMLVVHGG